MQDTEYTSLIQAARTLEDAMMKLSEEEGMLISPAWRMVSHAQTFVLTQAEELFRKWPGEEVNS